MNPYEILDLPRDCTTAEVRRAYRKLAQQHHPDKGGDAEQFARLKLAHDILTDLDRRARFDATGDASETSPDNSLVEVLSFLSIAMQTAVVSQYECITQADLIALMRGHLQGAAANARQESQSISRAIAVWGDVAKRVTAKRGKPNHLQTMCRANIQTLEQRLKDNERRIETITKALDMLADFKFRSDASDIGAMPLSAFNVFRGINV